MTATNYIWDFATDSYLMEKDDAGNTTAVYTNEPVKYGKLISQRRDGTTSYYHFDGQGSTRQMTDQNGDVTDEYTYSAFGEAVASSGSAHIPFKYGGIVGYYLHSTPLQYHVRARSLDATRGRWISCDHIDLLLNGNSYTYVSNAPITTIDPSGLFAGPLPPGACASTDCDATKGIATTPNPNADPNCKNHCLAAIVDTHEGEHRKNMGACCKLMQQCVQTAKNLGLANAERNCRAAWAWYKRANRISFELRAGVESCKSAAAITSLCFCPNTISLFDRKCCELAAAQLYLCKGNDPNAQILCCPYQDAGGGNVAVNLNCVTLLIRASANAK